MDNSHPPTPSSTGNISNNDQSAILRDISRNESDDPHVKAACRSLQDAIELPKAEIHDYLKEMLPLNSLFIIECFIVHRIFALVRRVMKATGIPIIQDRTKPISLKVAQALYRDPAAVDEVVARVAAYHRSKNLIVPSETPPSHSPVHHITVGTGDNQGLSRSKATIMNAFKDEDKFSGSVSGKIPLHRAKNRYLDIIRDQSIPREQESDLLHCCLKGLALDYYYKSIRGICTSVEQAFTLLENHFNSLQHQVQARTYLRNLTLEGIQRENECSALEALEIAHTRINDTAPNCGREYQHDVHSCDFLERIVQKQPWAERVIQDRLTPSPNQRFDYNTFYSKLCASLTAWELSHKNDDSIDSQRDTVGTAPTFYGEQYAVPLNHRRPPRVSRTRTPRSNIADIIRGSNRIKDRMTSTQLALIKSKTRCLLCKQFGHWRHECPNRTQASTKSVMLSLVQGLGNDDQAVTQTLWAVSEDDDEWYAYNTMIDNLSEPTIPTNSGNSFEAIVNSNSDFV